MHRTYVTSTLHEHYKYVTHNIINKMATRKIMMLYGEKTVQVNYRVPESKKDEIDEQFSAILKKYENPKRIDVEVRESDQLKPKNIASQKPETIKENAPKWKQNPEKKSNAVDDNKSIEHTKELVSKVKKAPFVPNSQKNKVDINDILNIAAGKGVKSELFSTEKKPIDEIYDCVEVERGVPQEVDRIYYGSNNRIAFWDKDDATIFYVNWDGKYYRFVTSSHFLKFCKENNIK